MTFGPLNTPAEVRPWIAAGVFAMALLAGCGKSQADLVASSAAFLAKGEVKSATIQARTALQKGESPQARLLLGRALLMQGDARGAEVELRRAVTALDQPEQAIAWLAEAQWALGQDKALLAEWGSRTLTNPKDRAQLKTVLAAAHARLQQRDLSEKAVQEALAADPDHVPARLMKARLLAAGSDADAAVKQLDGVLGLDARSVDAHLLKAEVLWRLKRDTAGAAAAYQAALAVNATALDAHAGLITLALNNRDWASASRYLDALKSNAVIGKSAQALYLETKLALATGNTAKAKDVGALMLKASPEHPQVLELAGSVALQSGQLSDAQVHLQNAIKQAPGLQQARLALAITHLRQSQPAKALAMLQPLTTHPNASGRAFSIAGEAYLQQGDYDKAAAAFQQVSRVNPSDNAGRTSLAMLKLNQGDVKSAVSELETIAAADADSAADLALISIQLRQRQFAEARKSIARLTRKQPQLPLPMHLRGLAQLGQGQVDDARQSFDQAVETDAKFYPALGLLVQLDVSAGKSEEALKRVQTFLQGQPGHAEASQLLVALRRRLGAPGTELAEILAGAVNANAADPSLRHALIRQHASNARKDLALETANQAAAAFPNDLSMAEALGRAQLAQGEKAQGLSTLGKLGASLPANVASHLSLASTYLAFSEFDAARAILRRALTHAGAQPNEVQARRVALELAAKQPDEALKISRDMQKAAPSRADGFVAEGDVHATREQWPASLASFRQAVQKQRTPATVARLHGALVRSGASKEADALLQGWAKDNPQDLGVSILVGTAALNRRDFAAAEPHFARLLERQPNDVVVLNNLAWAKLQRGGADALPLAQKAFALDPSTPAVADTLASVLIKQGRPLEAIDVLKRAVATTPAYSPSQLSLARAYASADQKAQAKATLAGMAKLNLDEQQRSDIAALSATLQ
jgi:cellulose synthase operon protein C